MSRIKLKKVDQISRKTVSDARDGFLRHCQLKNLAPHTYTYYKENLQFFFDSAPQVKFVDEFNQEVIENFIGQLMDKGNRVTAINARLRAAYVFLRYCFEQEYFPFHSLDDGLRASASRDPNDGGDDCRDCFLHPGIHRHT